MHSISIKDERELGIPAREFVERIGKSTVFAFYGEMGAGKTTFIKVLCEILEATDVVTSPTFSIINEYHTTSEDKIFHFDFYRIKNTEEVFNLGYEDYFYDKHYCFIEWPELVEELLPDHMLKVKIIADESGTRTISW